MTSLDIKPFTITIPQDEIDDLNNRLARTRWPDTIPGSEWTYGIDSTGPSSWPPTGVAASTGANRPRSTVRRCISSTSARPSRTHCR